MGQLADALPLGDTWAYELRPATCGCALLVFRAHRWVATVPPADVQLHAVTQALLVRPEPDARGALAAVADALALAPDVRAAYDAMAAAAAAAHDALVAQVTASSPAVPDMPGYYVAPEDE